jgi:hypothetical protein
MKTQTTIALVLSAGLLTLSPRPSAGTEPEPNATAAQAEEEAIGLNLDVGLATAYVFRGYNVFQEDAQLDPHLLVSPTIAWAVFDTGLSIAYQGYFQISGGNIQDRMDAALGAEQDLTLAYTLGLPLGLGLWFGVVNYLYPAADEDVVGAACPYYFEPGVGLTWSGPVDLSLRVSYFLGIQDEPAIRGISYLYINPRVGRTFAFGHQVKLSSGLGYGFKLWKEGNDGASNIHDLILDLSLPIEVIGGFYVSPGVHAGWTNLAGKGFADELFVYGGLNLGVNL